MTVQAHIFMDGTIYSKVILEHVPRAGDTVRLGEGIYCLVTEVVWCLDESTAPHDRVNIRTVNEDPV